MKSLNQQTLRPNLNCRPASGLAAAVARFVVVGMSPGFGCGYRAIRREHKISAIPAWLNSDDRTDSSGRYQQPDLIPT